MMSTERKVKRSFQWMALLLMLLPLGVMAQTIQVKGTVVDNTGLTVIGASVIEKGTTNGVITDLDGNFTLSDVPQNGTLQSSYVGYKTQEVPVAGKHDFYPIPLWEVNANSALNYLAAE